MKVSVTKGLVARQAAGQDPGTNSGGWTMVELPVVVVVGETESLPRRGGRRSEGSLADCLQRGAGGAGSRSGGI